MCNLLRAQESRRVLIARVIWVTKIKKIYTSKQNNEANTDQSKNNHVAKGIEKQNTHIMLCKKKIPVTKVGFDKLLLLKKNIHSNGIKRFSKIKWQKHKYRFQVIFALVCKQTRICIKCIHDCLSIPTLMPPLMWLKLSVIFYWNKVEHAKLL